MRLLFILLFLFPGLSFGGLERLKITNLNFDYTSPKGTGTADKIEVGMSTKRESEAVEVEKVEDTFIARTGIVEFQWIDPWKELLEVEKLQLRNTTLSGARLKHDLSVPNATIYLKGEYKILNGTAHCEGTSELPELENRLLEDCRENLKAEADRLDVPLDFFLVDILNRLPQPPEEEPLKNFTLTVKEGEFYLYFLANYGVKAGLRGWGAVHYEDELKTMVIRVDLVKFGYIPITSIVMKELKKRIKAPNVTVAPPFIRIRMRE